MSAAPFGGDWFIGASRDKPVRFLSIVVPAYNENDVIVEFNRAIIGLFGKNSGCLAKSFRE